MNQEWWRTHYLYEKSEGRIRVSIEWRWFKFVLGVSLGYMRCLNSPYLRIYLGPLMLEISYLPPEEEKEEREPRYVM